MVEEVKLTIKEACERVSAAIVVFTQLGEIVFEQSSELKDAMKSLCPEQPDFSKESVVPKED